MSFRTRFGICIVEISQDIKFWEENLNFLRILHVAFFTFLQAACSTFVAFLVGILAAFFCGRRKFLGRKFLLSLSVVPFCVPSLIIALAYVSFLGLNGTLNHFLMFVFKLKNPPVKILYSFLGLVLAQGFYNFPLIMKNVSEAWQKLPNETAESARLLGASESRIFRTITIYQLLPSIASSSLIVFIYCFLSFILVLLFGGIGNSTLEVEIYKAARASLDFKTAFILAFLETAILCILTVLYELLEKKSSKAKGLQENFFVLKRISGAKEICAFTILIILLLIFFIFPLFGIFIDAFSSKKIQGFTFSTLKSVVKMKSFLPSLKTTFFLGICTGFFCTLFGFLYSVFLKFLENKEKSYLNSLNSIFKILPMLPMCVSSVVLGVIIIILIPRGNIFCLIFAQSFLNWPLAYKIIYSQMTKISFDTVDSGLLLSKNKFDFTLRVLLPVSKNSLISAFGFCFALSAGDTTLPLVLSIPKFNTLSLFTYRLAGSYRFNEACAAGLILATLCVVIFSLSGNLDILSITRICNVNSHSHCSFKATSLSPHSYKIPTSARRKRT